MGMTQGHFHFVLKISKIQITELQHGIGFEPDLK